jgi:phosphatidate cytidylyltransferase
MGESDVPDGWVGVIRWNASGEIGFQQKKVAPPSAASKARKIQTWEGLIGGWASATVLGAALHFITPFGPWEAALVALAINMLGFCGGLVMSASKRSRGIRDWAHLIEGHGSMLDWLDSVVLPAPVFFHLTRIGWT